MQILENMHLLVHNMKLLFIQLTNTEGLRARCVTGDLSDTLESLKNN